jgi:hypothetical protein
MMPPGRHRRLIEDGDTFTPEEMERGEVELVKPPPNPEPDDIDRVSREHGPAWRERFRDRGGQPEEDQ